MIRARIKVVSRLTLLDNCLTGDGPLGYRGGADDIVLVAVAERRTCRSFGIAALQDGALNVVPLRCGIMLLTHALKDRIEAIAQAGTHPVTVLEEDLKKFAEGRRGREFAQTGGILVNNRMVMFCIDAAGALGLDWDAIAVSTEHLFNYDTVSSRSYPFRLAGGKTLVRLSEPYTPRLVRQDERAGIFHTRPISYVSRRIPVVR